MTFHKRGGARAGAGRPAKAPTKTIRIEEKLGDKIKDLSKELDPHVILSKWESIVGILRYDQPLHEQENRSILPDNLAKALLNDAVIKLLDKIFENFSPDDFLSYWEDIDLTETEPVPKTTPQKPDIQEIIADLPLFQFQKSVLAPEKEDTKSTPGFESMPNVTPQKLDVAVEFSDYKTSDGNFLTKEQYNPHSALQIVVQQATKNSSI